MGGQVVTISGEIDPDEMGVTSTHEHLFLDLGLAWFEEPKGAFDRAMSRNPVTLEDLWWIRRNTMSSVDNGRLDDLQEAIDEILKYRGEGGGTIVECTTRGLGGDPKMLRYVANQTGLKIIAGAGYYVSSTHPPDMDKRAVAELEREIRNDVLKGFGDTGIRAGIIGEIGVAGTQEAPIEKNELKVLKAAARAQAETGAPISVHPPRMIKGVPTSKLAWQILDVLEDEGADLEKVIICHLDRSCYENVKYQEKIADRGAYIEYDLWGLETYNERFNDAYQHDMMRVFEVKQLIKDGYIDNLLFAHDVCMKIQRTKYGGSGYGHILRSVVPMLKVNGVSNQQLQKILVKNPRRALQFK